VALDLRRRSSLDELMDSPATGYEEFRGCLEDLARVNRITLAHRPTLAYLDALVASGPPAGRPLEIVDVGSGYGDGLRAIDAWARRRRVPVRLTGVDLNPWSARAAAAATPHWRGIDWVTADAFEHRPPRGIDVVVSSLFTHHLDDEEVVRFLDWMEHSARIGWFVSDLHRHALPYHFFRGASRLMGLHPFVQHDGPLSIARAFVAGDWWRLLGRAGVAGGDVDVRWSVPFRINVGRRRR